MTFTTVDNNLFLQSYNPFVLNKNASKILDKEGIIHQLQLLSLHGVSNPIANEFGKVKKLNYQSIYFIPVFQQKVLAVYRQTKSSSDNWINSTILKSNNKIYLEKIRSFNSKREEKRVKSEAIKAVYALNLDYAVVKVGVTMGTKPWILFVNPFQESNQEINKLFADATVYFKEQWQLHKTQNKKVTLGADPEFVLENENGKLVLASLYLPKNGLAGCDRIWTNRDRNQLPLAELRPKQAAEPRELMINLYQTLLVASKKIKDRKLKWLAGAMPIKGYSIGGHIHFSNIWLNSFLLRALDNYLALPITLLEDENGNSRRPNYGFLGDYREQFHGGFEYRTLPSWLVSPTITMGVFALSKLIAENYFYLYQNPLENKSVQRAYYLGDKDSLRPYVEELWDELRQLSGYKLYENYLSPFEQLINKGFKWNERIDIRRAWHLPPYNKRN